jgi:hypothetical protein
MRFWTPEEAAASCKNGQVPCDDRGRPLRPTTSKHHIQVPVPPSYTQLNWFCRYLERSLQPHKGCLLWVTDWGVWDENLHLYYRLRQSYGDQRLLHEAPGHYFLQHEGPDLASFLEVAILCGWDVHLLPSAGYSRAFVSHDEFVEFAADDNNPDLVKAFESQLPRSSPKASA